MKQRTDGTNSKFPVTTFSRKDENDCVVDVSDEGDVAGGQQPQKAGGLDKVQE